MTSDEQIDDVAADDEPGSDGRRSRCVRCGSTSSVLEAPTLKCSHCGFYTVAYVKKLEEDYFDGTATKLQVIEEYVGRVQSNKLLDEVVLALLRERAAHHEDATSLLLAWGRIDELGKWLGLVAAERDALRRNYDIVTGKKERGRHDEGEG